MGIKRNQEVAARLRMTRQALNLKQAALCRLTGISIQSWNNIERQHSGVAIETALKLCDGLGLTLDWIFRGRRDYLPAKIREALAQYERGLETQQKEKVIAENKQKRSKDKRDHDDEFLCV